MAVPNPVALTIGDETKPSTEFEVGKVAALVRVSTDRQLLTQLATGDDRKSVQEAAKARLAQLEADSQPSKPDAPPSEDFVRCVVLRPLQLHGVDYKPMQRVRKDGGKVTRTEADRVDLTAAQVKQLHAAPHYAVVELEKYSPAKHDPVELNGEALYWPDNKIPLEFQVPAPAAEEGAN